MTLQALPRAPAAAPVAVAFAGLAALAVAMGIGRFAFTPILPMMQGDAGLSLAEGGWLASANYLGYLAGALWAAGMPVRSAVAVRAGLVAIVVATFGMSIDSGVAGWALLRAAAGVASAWVLIHVSAWCLERLAPAERPFLEGTVFAGVGVGIAVAGLVCVGLLAVQASSASAWRNLGLVSLAVTALLWNAFGSAGAAAHAPAAPRRWSPGSVHLVLAYGAFGFGYIIPATFIPVFAKELIRDSLAFGWAWPVFGAAAAFSTVLLTLAAGRASSRALWLTAQLVMAFGVSAPLVAPGVTGVALSALLVGGTFMVITMTGMQEARRVVAPHAAGLMAAMTAAFAAGQIAGPLLVSVLLARGAAFSAALLAASAVLVAGACALFLRGSNHG